MAKEKKELTKRELDERKKKRILIRNRIIGFLVIAVMVLAVCAQAFKK